MKTKPTAAEVRDADVRSRAVRFSAVIYLGRGRRIVRPLRTTLATAARDARELDGLAAAEGNHRGALVLGVTTSNEGSHFPRSLWPDA